MSAGQNVFNENETIAKYEIMDGAPVRGRYIEACQYSVVQFGSVWFTCQSYFNQLIFKKTRKFDLL